ncbi:MAG: HAMP domain-containing sensor histidine kinase [Elusimicrobiota bacterium]|jgi:signal transduction histidine kinase
MTLRTKFTFGALLLTEAALLTSMVVVLVVQRRQNLVRRNQESGVAVERFAEVCRDSVVGRYEIPVVNYMRALSEDPKVRYSLFVEKDGRVRLHSALFRGDRSMVGSFIGSERLADSKGLLRAENGERMLEWARPVNVDGVLFGFAIVGYSEGALDRELLDAMKATIARQALAAVPVSILALGGAFLLAWRLNRSIHDLSQTALRIGEGDLSVRTKADGKDELGSLGRVFNLMVERLQLLQEAREHMTAGLTHDLKAPLAAIHAHAQLLRAQEGDKLKPESQDSIDRILVSARRMALMAEDILDRARLREGGEIHIQRAEISIHPLIDEAVRLLKPAAQDKGLKIENAVDPSLPKAQWDPAMMTRVFVNLLSNAVKFTPRGGTITLKARAKGRGVEVSVSDTGRGIPAADLKHLFTRFMEVRDADGSRVAGSGTGLGLSICREIVAAHEGSIEARSEVSRGTTILIELPLEHEKSPADS